MILKQKKYFGFTLVELIIVITILAILATIAFVSFQSYTKNARDSNRTSTLTSLQKGIDIYSVQTGTLPQPEGTISSGSVNGVQLTKVGIIGDVISKIVKINTLPTDPIGGNNYVYGISGDNKYYQISSTLESQGTYKANVVGNYIYPLKLVDKIYSLPSLIFTGTGGDLTQAGNAYFVINEGQNIPYSPSGVLNNTISTTQILQAITGTGGLSITGVTIPLLSSTEFKSLTSTSTTLQSLQQSLGITDQNQLGTIIYGNAYLGNSNIGQVSGGLSQLTYLQNCTNVSSSSGIIYTDSVGVEIARVTNAGVTISGDPNLLTCAGTIIVCSGNQTGYVLDACNVGNDTVVGTTSSSYGYYFQWGNNAFMSGGTASSGTQISALGYGPGNYYNSQIFRYGYTDWSSSQNDNLWGSGGTVFDRQGPCPNGYHIPTGGPTGEWNYIYISGGWSSVSTNRGYAFTNSLKMPISGYRRRSDGILYNPSITGTYWSSSTTGVNAYNVSIDASNVDVSVPNVRANGFNLRCIKN